jgi:hypothetical protein
MVGPVDEVYRGALKVSSKIGIGYERNFNTTWNKTILAVVNRPSEGKSMLNLGTYQPKDKFGLYDLKTPAQLLSQKLSASKMPGATFAARAGVDEASLYRHLSGTAISREAAVKYAKVLGCDPAELLFNPLLVPVWGRVDTQEMKSINKLAVYSGEIRPNTKDEYALCPREIYRPDVKCLVVDQENSVYHNNHIFYYHSNEVSDLDNQLVVAGAPVKNFGDGKVRYRYFLGIYKHSNGQNPKAINLISIDPFNPLHEVNTYEEEYGPEEMVEALKDPVEVINGIVPTFVAPVVSIVNPARIAKSELRSDIIKDHEKFYSQARMSDQMNILKYKELLQKELLKAQTKTKETFDLAVQKKTKETEKELMEKAQEMKAKSESINNDMKALFEKFEQQQQMAHKQAMETSSKGGNPFFKAFTDRFYHERHEQKAKEQQLEDAIMEQRKAIEKLKEAVSVPELFEEGKRHDDEDKVA